MGRKSRVEYPGAIYHVYHRGNNREFILSRNQDKLFLLEQIEHAVDTFGLEVFAYAVMKNHYHMGIRTGNIPLSAIMHRINSNYSRYYNQEFDRSGHVFEGRYRAIPIENESYFLTVIRYIHQNPVRAGICTDTNAYPWSSDMEYRGQRTGFVNTDYLLDILSNNRQIALREYATLMNTEVKLDSMDEVKFMGQQSNESGTINADGQRDGAEKESPSDPSKCSGQKPALDDILKATGLGVQEYIDIKQGSRKRHLIPFKRAFIKEAIIHGYNLTEIGQAINISDSAASQLLK